jgi:hypothetical protein
MKSSKFILISLLGAIFAGPAQAEIALYDHDGYKFTTNGFLEMDAIHDSTRSFSEVMGNAPVERTDSALKGGNSNGALGKTQFSMRNSRLAFGLMAPESDGWKTRGYFEFDFFGASNSPEGSLYNSPTFRMRHAYVQGENENWQILAGQTWMLFGWQPYYFLPVVDVSPIAGMLYARTAQVRGLRTIHLNDQHTLQAAAALLRPPQADSEIPDIQAGVRYASTTRTSGFVGGTGARTVQPMSFALSGAIRQFVMPNSGGAVGDETYYQGQAIAADVLVPIMASADGKDVSNTLTLAGEWSMGKGYGDQFGSWTGNTANPLSAATTGTAATQTKLTALNLDGGIGDYDSSGTFRLIYLQHWNVNVQYHLPHQIPYWFTLGYTQLHSDNMASLVTGNNVASSGKMAYDNVQTYYGNVFHQFTAQIRGGLEVAHTIAHYGDEETTTNNRFQASGWWLF